MALPRLTGALRSFSNVTKQDNYNEEVADLKETDCPFQKRRLDGKEEDQKMSRTSNRKGLR
uniref:Uncharacterized protein n=1 Tax=Propithecus coquereli TaxID=379532 RepID=A0A2K6G940_PROCO